MSSIAIFPCAFTPVADVASDLAEFHGLPLVNDTVLIEDTARVYGTSTEKLERALYGKTSVFNNFTLEREKCLNQLKSVLARKLSEHQGGIIYGAMAILVSPRISHIVRAVIVDSRLGRIAEAEKQGFSERTAKKLIHDEDLKCFYLTDFLFKKEAFDSCLYDLVVPVEGRGVKALSRLISGHFQKISVLRTTASQQAVLDMVLEAKIERLLLAAGHKLDVTVMGDRAILKVENSVLNFDRLVQEITSLIRKKEPGIKSVRVEKGINYNDSIYRRQKFDLPSKVLFVDDEKEFVETISQRLISRDVGTYCVYNGMDALALIEEDCPDVMVLDLKMPGLNGVEVLREAKKIAPHVEVIILTGHGTQLDKMACMALGAFEYLHKPVDITVLSETIKAAHEKVLGFQVTA